MVNTVAGGKQKMQDFIIGKDLSYDTSSWKAPKSPMLHGKKTIPKGDKYNDEDIKAIQKNAKEKKLFICSTGPMNPTESDHVQLPKKCKILYKPHMRTSQVKKSKVLLLNRQYELFKMNEGESLQEMFHRFANITNKLLFLGVVIPQAQIIMNVLDILPDSWESKVNAIIEARDLETMTMEEVMGNLKTYEMRKLLTQKNIPQAEL